MFGLNDAWASTSNDLILQGKLSKALDARVAALESDHCTSSDLTDIDRALKRVDVKVQEVTGKIDAAAIRSYQAAFFSDTMLQSLESLYKSPEDEKLEGTSQAVMDMSFLLRNALLSVAKSAALTDDKISSIVDMKVSKAFKVSKDESEKIRKSEAARVDDLMLNCVELPKRVRQNLLDDREFVRSVASQVPQISDEPIFKSNVEDVVMPLLKTTNAKVSPDESRLYFSFLCDFFCVFSSKYGKASFKCAYKII
jgi:hypothetical protein